MSNGPRADGPWNSGQGPWPAGEGWVNIDDPLPHVVQTDGLTKQEIGGGRAAFALDLQPTRFLRIGRFPDHRRVWPVRQPDPVGYRTADALERVFAGVTN